MGIAVHSHVFSCRAVDSATTPVSRVGNVAVDFPADGNVPQIRLSIMVLFDGGEGGVCGIATSSLTLQ